MSWSLRRRLAVSVVATVAIGFAVIAVALYVGVRDAAWEQHDRALGSRARALAAIAEHEDGHYEMVLPPTTDDEPPVYIEVWTPDDQVLLRSPSLGSGDLPRGFAPARDMAFEDVLLPDQRPGRAVALRFVARSEDDAGASPLLLVLAEGTEPIDATVATVRRVFLWVGLAALLAIGAVTTWVVARGTRPLAALSEQIERIDDRQLATRLSVAGQPIELQGPVRKLDELLARLEAAFVRERELTADVSHELRTPLAGLRTLLEVTALGDRSVAEYRTALADALDMVKQLCTMVENLLTLAQLDAGEVGLAVEEVDLHALIEGCWAPHAAVAGARSVAFRNHVAKASVVRTDREKLRIVVSNLLANAAEYTERGGWIEVTNSAEGISVADSGPAIPVEHLDRIFDRLWRGDAARAGNGVHCGIGLALSRSLCDRLGLSLNARSSADGTVTFAIASPGFAGGSAESNGGVA